ncbi:MAG TPA: LPS assembly protein LptD [Verrucomicrobiae bacterium]|nr:LPS assembly protein LptD [Verrucomicrobiae bacterium]
MTSPIEIRSLRGEGTGVTYDRKTQVATGTNGVFINYEGSVLIGDSVSINEITGDAVADGSVRIQRDDQIWVGEHMRYNFITHQIISQEFRSGRPPVFMAGEGLHGNVVSNSLKEAISTNAIITTDDIADPEFKLRATRMKIYPNEKLQAWNAVLYMHGVPMFYFPYYERNLGPHANNFNFVPGYRSLYGPYILGEYTWWLNDDLSGKLHLDYREKRGPGVGPDFDYKLGRWGEGSLSYYYTHDQDPQTNFVDGPVYQNRERVYFSYQAMPYTNLELHALARYESDAGVNRDFFERDYRDNPQPNTFIEADKQLQNFSVDVLTQPRVNDFLETVERLPDVQVTGFRQQLWNLPFYYESQSSAGYYRRLFADTNAFVVSTNFEAARADTYHQVTLPETFFGWLNIVPRVGGRFTYYSAATGPGASTDEVARKVFNTGAEVSFKLSRLWEDAHCSLLAVDGLRHIIEPSANYVYIPTPNATPNQVPQFDYELPSLALLPIEFPEFNSIDSIDSQNAIRWGLRNQLQTKRDGQLEDLLDWQLYVDWNLKPQENEETFSDLYSDLVFRPRSWIRFESQTRFDINGDDWRFLLHTLTLQPNDVWSWTIGHFYLRNDFSTSPTALGQGDDAIMSAFFYRLNENWSTRAVHQYDVRSGRLQEQYYSLYRDFRSWTAAITGGIRDNGEGPLDYSIGFTFSIKAMPKYGVGGDTVRPYTMLGLQN